MNNKRCIWRISRQPKRARYSCWLFSSAGSHTPFGLSLTPLPAKSGHRLTTKSTWCCWCLVFSTRRWIPFCSHFGTSTSELCMQKGFLPQNIDRTCQFRIQMSLNWIDLTTILKQHSFSPNFLVICLAFIIKRILLLHDWAKFWTALLLSPFSALLISTYY